MRNIKQINSYTGITKESSNLGIIHVYDLQKVYFTENNLTEKIRSMKNLLHDWVFRNHNKQKKNKAKNPNKFADHKNPDLGFR